MTQLIEQNGVLPPRRGEVTTLLGWIDVVEPTSQDHPWLYIMKAWAYALTGNLEHVSGMLQVAEELISPLEDAPEVRIMKGTIAAARAYMANVLGKFGTAMTHARQALEYLPDSGLIPRSLRTVAISLLGDASSMSGNLEEAWQAYLEAEPIAQAAGDINLIIGAQLQPGQHPGRTGGSAPGRQDIFKNIRDGNSTGWWKACDHRADLCRAQPGLL